MKGKIKAEWWDRQQKAIAQGCLTNSKHPMSHMLGLVPTHIKRCWDSTIMDVEEREYTDYICGLGTNLFGYRNHHIRNAIDRALNFCGISCSLATTYEVEGAEKLKEVVPFVDRWKFVKTGTHACDGAVKIARAFTGRELILSEGYHGWSQDFCFTYEGKSGYGIDILGQDLKIIEEKKPAAVIVEPVQTDWSEKRRDFIYQLRKLCTDHGVVLIFDEVITGLRWPKFSVASDWNVYPDIICLGKALGGGFPLAAIGGKAEIMDNPGYFVSGTHGGEIASLAAMVKAIDLLRGSDQRYHIDRLWEKGSQFIGRFNETMAGTGVSLEGYPTRGVFRGTDQAIALFLQETILAGILFGKSWFYNFTHPQHDEITFKTLEPIADKLRAGSVRRKAPLPTSPLAQKARS